jgi:hypothetical protein
LRAVARVGERAKRKVSINFGDIMANAKLQRNTATAAAARRIQLAGGRSPLKLLETRTATGGAKSAVAPKSVPTGGDDPTGIKTYIAFSVAHALYPQGAGVNPDQDISDDVTLNSVTIAAEINVDAQHSATMHQLAWTPVTATQVAKLKTVSDLVALVKSKLAAARAAQ